jgi:signal transduction histidine kinase/FixJ family two-component response regulator
LNGTRLITFYKINTALVWQYNLSYLNKIINMDKQLLNSLPEITPELRKYINQYFKEYHIKDCLIILPAQNIFCQDCDTKLQLGQNIINTIDTNKFVIRHVSASPSTEGLTISLVPNSDSANSTANKTDNNPANITPQNTAHLPTREDLHELIGDYLSRLATLVEQTSFREPKPAAIWKHRNFLSSISHQIKTPLSAIFSGTKLIKHYTNNEYIDRICEYMNQSCVELTRYMNDIIDFYYLKQGILVLDDNRVSLADTITYVHENYRLQLQDSEIEFNFRIDPEVPAIINCDELRLTQILMNLMDNAVKFTNHPSSIHDNNQVNTQTETIDNQPDKQILIHIFTSNTNTAATEEAIGQKQITVQIADTGIGKIDLENQEIYFQPFNQTTRNWLCAPDGIGLGLCLSRDFARQMGGELRFINPENVLTPPSATIKGNNISSYNTCIELILPIGNSASKYNKSIGKSTTEKQPSGQQNQKIGKGVRIMEQVANTNEQQQIKQKTQIQQIVLIDDNQTNLELLTLILIQLGHQKHAIITFTNSLEGQQYIKRHSPQISHAIIDIRMPRKNGLELIDEIATEFADIHFILLTALNHSDVRDRYQQIKTTHPQTQISLLFKPINCGELEKIINLAPSDRATTAAALIKPTRKVSTI